MQMMIEPQEEYKPRHQRLEVKVHGLKGLRKIIDKMPDGVVCSIDLGVFTDGKKKKIA